MNRLCFGPDASWDLAALVFFFLTRQRLLCDPSVSLVPPAPGGGASHRQQQWGPFDKRGCRALLNFRHEIDVTWQECVFGEKRSLVFIASDEKMRMVDDTELQPEAFQSAAANHTRKTTSNYSSFPVALPSFIKILWCYYYFKSNFRGRFF